MPTAPARALNKRAAIPHPVDGLGRHVVRSQITNQVVTRSRRDDGEGADIEPDVDAGPGGDGTDTGTSGDGSIGFKGTAIVFNKRTWIGGRRWGFWEEIAPEAVTKTLLEADVRFLFNHDPNLILARNTAGTLRREATPEGLQVDADMAPTTYGLNLAISLERKDITQMSFAFDELAYEWSEAEDGNDLYRVTELTLYDVSPVAYPAYTETDAGLRSLAFELMCRRAGVGPADQRRLMRHFAIGEPIEPSIVQQLRSIEAEQLSETTPPNGRGDSGPAETTRDNRPPAETTVTTPPDISPLLTRSLVAEHSLKGI